MPPTPVQPDSPAIHPSTAPVVPAPRRLWFHLDDVLPLATHAASTPGQHLTQAQLMAHAPLVPALAWTDAYGSDALVSNGAPAWHDSTGELHCAHACTWVPVPAGPHSSPEPAAATVGGFMPLRSPEYGGFDLPAWLSQAVTDGAHWLSIDITRPHLVITPDHLDVRAERGDLYPPDTAWSAGEVACVPMLGAHTYPALIADNYQSLHSGLVARFTRDTVTQMITDLDQPPTDSGYPPSWNVVLRWDGERVQVFNEHRPARYPVLRRYDVVSPDRDGYYPLGAHLWQWLRLPAD